MNWKQLMAVLTLVVAMFSTVVIVSTYYNISGFERVEGRIDQLSGRIDRIDGRIDQLESKLGGRIDQLESKLSGRIDQLERELGGRIDRLDEKVDVLSNEVAEIKGALKAKGIMANK